MALQLTGGTTTAPNRALAAKVIAGALANERVANSLIANLGTSRIQAMIIAAHTSATTDFAALAVGDIVIHIGATAGNADFAVVATAGTLPNDSGVAVVGDLYMAMRVVNLDANNPLIPPPPAALTGRMTGNGGTEF